VAVVVAALVMGRGDRAAQAAPGDTIADLVYGQFGSFTAGNQNCATSTSINAGSLCGPNRVFIDSAGRLWVADTLNHRVLEYDTPLTSATANRVYGQFNSFAAGTCNNGGTSANSLCYPSGVTVDALGHLYVADSGNNRVLEYDTPLTSSTANRVLGQFNSFITNTYNNGGTSANSLWNPDDVAVDASGNLYVSDRWNYRVLEYNSPTTTDTVADRVFGQGGNLNSGVNNLGGVSSSSLSTLLGLDVDSTGKLYVADEGNNRVLVYFTPLTNQTANFVFGQQGSFTSNIVNNGGISASSMYIPTGITVDSGGNVYISETGNERVLEFNNPFATDTIADQVFGHGGSFTASTNNSVGLNASALADPWSVTIDSDCHLWVADLSNNRALEYDSPPPGCALQPPFTPTSTVCPVSFCTATPTPTDTDTPTVTPTPTETPACTPALGPCTPTPTPCTGGPPPPAPCTPTPTSTDTPTPTPTCDASLGIVCGTDTPTPTPTCDPAVGCATDTPMPTPTCDSAGGTECGTNTPTSTSTPTSTPTSTNTPNPPTATKTPVTIGTCPPLLTGVLVGTIISGISPGGGTVAVTVSHSGTGVLGGVVIGGIAGMPSEPVVGTVSCGVIRFQTTSGSVRFAGTISQDGTSMGGSYVAAPSPDLRVGDAGTWHAMLSTTDTDGDGYPDVLEQALNKDTNAYCNIMRADVDMDGAVTILDLSHVAKDFGKSIPPAAARNDQDADGMITILDLSRQAAVFGKSVILCP
jgi:sugar lactone lactonase YvrE